MKIEATKIKAKELVAGDLFSTADQEYWNGQEDNKSLGEKVYIRTEQPCPKDQTEGDIFKIVIKI